MRYDIADQQCLAIIKSCQSNAVQQFNQQEQAGQAGFDTAIQGCRGASSVSRALAEVSTAYSAALTSMKNFADSAAAGATLAITYYQTGDQHMAEQAATAAFQATTPRELPGRGGMHATID